MARNEALDRIRESLEERRRVLALDLSAKLGGLTDRGDNAQSGNLADAAFASDSDEIHSRVAQIESGELVQVQRALALLRNGTYGVCECCKGKIPVGRLNALPYSVLCIQCQSDLEEEEGLNYEPQDSWNRLHEAGRRSDEFATVDINRMAMELSY
jgi:DnaK suppressor protein